MAEAPKNKPSHLFSLISSVLLHFTMMLVLFALLRSAETTQVVQDQPSFDLLLVEFESAAQKQEIDLLRAEFASKFGELTAELNFVSKQRTLAKLASKSQRIPTINPLKDLLLIKLEGISPYLLSEVKTFLWGSGGVSGVFQDQIKSPNKLNSSQALLKGAPLRRGLALALGALLLFILPYLWLRALMRSFLSDNREQFRSLQLYGATADYFGNLLNQTIRKTLIKGWLAALALYFVVVYLFFDGLGDKIGHISTTKQFVVLLVPLIISFIISAVLARNPYFRHLEIND